MKLEQRIQLAFEGAAQQLPALAVERADFESRARALWSDDPEAILMARDLYLACACLRGDAEGVALLEREVLALVPRFLSRMAQTPSFIDEATQQLRDHLLVAAPSEAPKIASYSGRAPLANWVAVCAQRVAITIQRRAGRVADTTRALEQTVAADPELLYMRTRYAPHFEQALHEALAVLTARDKTLLRLSLVESMSLEQIGSMYKVNASTVSRWIKRCRESLAGTVERTVRTRLAVNDSEFESLSRLVRSELELRGLARALQEL